jgi:hypothetical protein
MEQSNRKKKSSNHPSTRLEDGKPINGMRLYIEEREDIYGNLANPHDDDDLSSIGNSISRYVDSEVGFLEDADGRKERVDVLGISEKYYIGVSVSRDSATAELDASLIQEAPPGSQPAALFRNDCDESKGWYISHRLCLPRWMQLAPTWLQVLVLGSLMLLIVSIVVAGIALIEINNGSSQSNPILEGPEAGPTPSPITMGQTNVFSPTYNVQDQINESQPTSSLSIPLEPGPSNIFSTTNEIPDQITETPQLRDPSVSPESSSLVLTNDLPLVEPPTNAPTTHPTQSPSVDALSLVEPPTSAPTTHPTQLPTKQPVDASSPSSPPTPQIRSTHLPSAQPVDTASTPSSPPTYRFSSGGKRYSFFRPSS